MTESIAADSQPNIIVIMTDDQRRDEAKVAMPSTLSLIADQGVNFSQSVVNSPLCAPSRATFLTGQYAHNHGVLANQNPYGYTALDHANTLAVWLQDVDYHTIFIDKYLNGYGETDPFEIPPGWSDWRAVITLKYYDYYLNLNGVLSQYGSDSIDYRTDQMSGQAVKALLAAPTDRPFFMWIATMAPHEDLCDTCSDLPTPAPRHDGILDGWEPQTPVSFNEADVSDKPEYVSRLEQLTNSDMQTLLHKEQKRLEALMSVDEMVEQIVEAVSSRRQLDNTIFVFTSDNGYMLGEHRIDKLGKKVPYEESIQVPLYLRGPGFPMGAEEHRLVSNQDLAPTLAALAGAASEISFDGIDFRNLPADRAVLLSNIGQKGPPAYDGVRTSEWVYIAYETAEEELYDIILDPFQLDSCHADPAYNSSKNTLRDILENLIDCFGVGCVATNSFPLSKR